MRYLRDSDWSNVRTSRTDAPKIGFGRYLNLVCAKGLPPQPVTLSQSSLIFPFPGCRKDTIVAVLL